MSKVTFPDRQTSKLTCLNLTRLHQTTCNLSTNMEYMTAIQKKRRHEAGDLEKWNLCQTKRVCEGVGICGRVEYGAAADCPMDTGHTAEHQQGPPNAVLPHPLPHPTTSRPAQCCPRCLAGEPGHINHILGY